MSPAAVDTVNTPGDLAGRVVWQADGPQRGLHNQRPDLLPRLSAGKPAAALPGLVSALLSMCGHAHLLASRLAIDAACGQPRSLTPDEARALQIETLREHLRRLWLDWPRLWPGPGAGAGPADAGLTQLKELHGCPVLQGPLPRVVAEAQPTLDDTRAWLATHVFDLDPALWLQRWQAQDLAWLQAWCASAATWPAQWLHQVQTQASALNAPQNPWWPDDEQGLRQLAADIAADPSHARRPLWNSHPSGHPSAPPHPHPSGHVETGPWCRLHQRAELSRHVGQPRSAWWRLAGRLVDLARLALPDHAAHAPGYPGHDLGPTGAAVLSSGALHLAHHSGVAWLEMARGTLLHWVQLDGNGPQARVLSAQVLAPTEWNFHPAGPVARLLDHLPPEALHAQAALAVAAWDPCVPFAVLHKPATPTLSTQEAPHA